jgi:hypothetical protein
MKVLVNLDLTGNQLLNARAQVLAADPASPAPGRVWYNSTDETLNFAINDGTVIALNATSTDADTLDGQDGSYYLARANHTGTQTTATISDFNSASQALIDAAINALVDSAPGTLDTLNELAAALGDDPNFATTITNALNAKPDIASGLIGNGSATSVAFTHNLNGNVVVEVKDATTGEVVYPDVVHTNANTATITFASAPANNAYRVTAIGG